MKKISAKTYARILYEATADLNKKQAEAAAANFVAILARNKHMRLADAIIEQYVKYSDAQNGIVAAEVTACAELSESARTHVTQYIQKMSGAEKVEITEKQDKNLLGGVMIKIGDMIVDASVKNQLHLLKKKLTA